MDALSERHRSEYDSLATTLGEDVYPEAISLRNEFAETTRTGRLRREGRELAEQLDEVSDTAQKIIRERAEETDEFDADYMAREGWELSYHSPEEVPEDLVFACRVFSRIVAARNEINWLFDETLSSGVPEGEEVTAAADRVAGRFPSIASEFEKIGINVPKVVAES